jgi:molecular chaperone DnaJ
LTHLDPYKVLEISPAATAEEIKRAFHKFAKENHPDKNPGNPKAEKKMKEASEAYSILSDPSRRQIYDASRVSHSVQHGVKRGRPSGVNFSDIFNMDNFFADSFKHVPQKGIDIESQVNITLEESINGCKKEINFESEQKLNVCNNCGGNGKGKNGKRVACPSCLGAGRVVSSRNMVMNLTPCEVCKGTGAITIGTCEICGGSGKVKISGTINIIIPPGVRSGQQLRIHGKGAPGSGGNGDLYVSIHVIEGGDFVRDGNHLKFTLKIPFMEFLNGSHREIKMLDGSIIIVEISPGMQPGYEIFVKGAGVKNMKSINKGDLIVKLEAEFPTRLTPRARKLIEELALEIK